MKIINIFVSKLSSFFQNDGTGRYNYSYMHSPPIVYRAGGDSSSNQFMNAAVKDNLGIVCLDPIVIAVRIVLMCYCYDLWMN